MNRTPQIVKQQFFVLIIIEIIEIIRPHVRITHVRTTPYKSYFKVYQFEDVDIASTVPISSP